MKRLFCFLCLLTVLAGCAAPVAEDAEAEASPSASVEAEQTPSVPAQDAAEIACWTLPALARDTEGSVSTGRTDVCLYAARGETESFHVVLGSTKGAAEITGFSVTEPAAADGTKLGEGCVECYREHYVDTPASPVSFKRTTSKCEAGLLPDGLIPLVHPQTGKAQPEDARIRALPASVAPGARVSFFVDITVPRGAAPGEYACTYTVETGAGAYSGKVTLTVWDFALPATPTLKSSFYLSTSYTKPDAYIEILKCRLQPNINRTLFSEEQCRSLMEELKPYGLYMADLRVGSGAYWQNPTMRSAPSGKVLQEAKRNYPGGLLIYDYFADEISDFRHLFPTVIEWADALRAEDIRPLVVMIPKNEMFREDGTPVLDYFVVMPQQYMDNKVLVRKAQKGGAEVWSYNCVGYTQLGPIWFTDYPLINFRIQAGCMNARAGLTGLLYWQLDYYEFGNPWDKAVGFQADKKELFKGDGQMMYPGRDAGYPGMALPSLRMKALRDGMDDYDYYALLCKAGLKEWALEQIARASFDFYTWSPDPAVLEDVRLKLGQKLDALGA